MNFNDDYYLQRLTSISDVNVAIVKNISLIMAKKTRREKEVSEKKVEEICEKYQELIEFQQSSTLQNQKLAREIKSLESEISQIRRQIKDSEMKSEENRERLRQMQNRMERHRYETDKGKNLRGLSQEYNLYSKKIEQEIEQLEGLIRRRRQQVSKVQSQVERLTEKKNRIELDHSKTIQGLRHRYNLLQNEQMMLTQRLEEASSMQKQAQLKRGRQKNLAKELLSLVGQHKYRRVNKE